MISQEMMDTNELAAELKDIKDWPYDQSADQVSSTVTEYGKAVEAVYARYQKFKKGSKKDRNERYAIDAEVARIIRSHSLTIVSHLTSAKPDPTVQAVIAEDMKKLSDTKEPFSSMLRQIKNGL